MSRRKPDWVSEVRLTVYDGPAESDAADRDEPLEPAEPSEPAPAEDDRPAGTGLPLRWCALLAMVALVLALTGGGLLNERRARTVNSTVLRYDHPRGVDLAGCPRDDVCQPLPDAALAGWLPPELAHATVLASSLLLDSTTSQTIHTMQLLAIDGLTLTVAGQCVLGAEPVPVRNTVTEAATGRGPTTVAFVRPGKVAGCSTALTVRVPPGKPVPMPFLRKLADELPQRLVG